MSTPLSAAIAVGNGSRAATSDELSALGAQREQLTATLRTLAGDLDGLDRRLSDLDWHQRRCGVSAESLSERSALDAQRARLTSRLRRLARELNDIDVALAARKGWQGHPSARVGTCPDCGYPSLDSGLCAFCRPRLAH